jgi:hypothetical protein
MRRLIAAFAAVLLSFFILLPVAAAADPTDLGQSGRVLMAVNGDVNLPAGDRADAVIVIHGTATIAGEVDTILVIQGTAVLTGARANTLVAIQSPVTLGPGTNVSGDVLTIESLVTKVGDARVGGGVRNLAMEAAGLGFILAPVVLLWLLGVALAGIVWALFVVAIGTRQVRAATSLMSNEAPLTAIVGLAGILLPILIAIPLFISIVGAPLGFGLLLVLWPIAAFLGWVVVSVWIGELIVNRLSPEVRREKPYFAAVVGAVVLDVCAIFPPAVMLATIFGYGAVLLLAWRAFRGTSNRIAVPSGTTVAGAPPTMTPVAG